MSFDLYVFDNPDVPDDEELLGELMEDQRRWAKPLSPSLANHVEELERRYPGMGSDDDVDASPWSSWPLTSSMLDGHCTGFSIRWSAADQLLADITADCATRGLTLYDPQAGQVVRPPSANPVPPGAKPKRAWFRRRDS